MRVFYLSGAATSSAILTGTRCAGVREYGAELARVAGCTLAQKSAGCGGDAGGAVLTG
jgi:hypothetical protein